MCVVVAVVVFTVGWGGGGGRGEQLPIDLTTCKAINRGVCQRNGVVHVCRHA